MSISAVAYGNGRWISVGGFEEEDEETWEMVAYPEVKYSDDGGLTWHIINTGYERLPESIGTDGNGTWIMASWTKWGDGEQFYRSTDNGATWSGISGLMLDGTRAVEYGDGVWIIGCQFEGDKLHRSTDGGLTWAAIDHAFNGGSGVFSVATDGNGTWVATGSNLGPGQPPGLARSTDNGVTWTSITATGTQGWAYSVNTNRNGKWFVGSENGRSIVSTDDGVTWTQGPTLPVPQTLWQVACNDGDIVGAATDGQLVISRDFGITWEVKFNQNGRWFFINNDRNGTWLAGWQIISRSGVIE